MKITIEKLIEEINNRKNKTEKDLASLASDYWTGYADALGELLEFIEDNK